MKNKLIALTLLSLAASPALADKPAHAGGGTMKQDHRESMSQMGDMDRDRIHREDMQGEMKEMHKQPD